MDGIVGRIRGSKELIWRVPLTLAFLVGIVIVHTLAPLEVNWQLMVWYAAVLILSAQISTNALEFFSGEGTGFVALYMYYVLGRPLPNPNSQAKDEDSQRKEVGFWTLMPSAFITWIFAKSINNSANYGTRWGVLGGVGYAGWYMSFFSAAFVGFVLRVRHGYQSLPTVIDAVYGPAASLGFGLLLLYRLWNEIWSNTVVVADVYVLEQKSAEWWAAAIAAAAIPAIYVLMGGMRSSLISDVFQAALGLIFLFIVLAIIGDRMPGGLSALWAWEPAEGWFASPETVVGASMLQGCLSYPFHDPVLTDRTFLSRPRTMAVSFVIGGLVSMMFIILFSAIGIYGAFIEGRQNFYAAPVVAHRLESAAQAIVTLIMMTSSLSTLDSTFSSVGKLVGLEFGGWFKLTGDTRDVRGPLRPTDLENVGPVHILLARVSIVVLSIVGTLYLLIETSSLAATEVSGTMVMGLGPPVWLTLFWKHNSAPGANDGWHKAPLAFIFSWVAGLFFGIVYTFRSQAGRVPEYTWAVDMVAPFAMGSGSFRFFFGWNVLGHLVCFASCALGFLINQTVWKLPSVDAQPTYEDWRTGERKVREGYEKAVFGTKADTTADVYVRN